MKITISNVIEIEDPSPEITKYCDTELTMANPEYTKKERMGFWLGKTPQKLYLYSRRGNTLILPFGVWERVLDLSPIGTPLKSAFFKAREVNYGSVSLYDYQTIAVNEMFDAGYGILQAPAGCGKTQMGLALIERFKRRALWITHTLDLLKQSRDRAAQYFDSSLFGTVSEGKVEVGETITFATVQTLSQIDLRPYRDYWDVIIVDECHRVTGSPTKLTLFYSVLSQLAAPHKIGLSATVHRSDGTIRATYAILGPVKASVPPEAVKDRVMQVGVKPRYTGTEDSLAFCDTDGTIIYAKLITYLTDNKLRNRMIRDDLVREKDHSCLILSDRIDHLDILRESLPPHLRERSALINGKMTTKKGKAEREAAIEDMRSGRLTYLFATYALAKEGLDIPRLDRLFLTTPQKDYAVVTQSVGRIARRVEGKDDPIVYDYVDGEIDFLVRTYKRRRTSYKKLGCYEVMNE